MKICSLSSGSKGNSLYVESAYARILIDAGISAQQIKERLRSIEVDPAEIDALVLTHSHNDHVRGAGILSRQMGIPIYAHPETLDSISYLMRRKEILKPWSESFSIKDLTFHPFRLSHDAFPTFGFLISNPTPKLAVCTDLGLVTGEVLENLRQARLVIIESNHDPEMLMNGPYPWELKERIASRVGHLSNHDTGLLLKNILNGNLNRIFLAHLSEENNTLDLAKNTVLEYIGPGWETQVEIFQQKTVSPIFEI
ncbi:MAG: MBL fold metallo-hydrolase [Calditrichia bacterium]